MCMYNTPTYMQFRHSFWNTYTYAHAGSLMYQPCFSGRRLHPHQGCGSKITSPASRAVGCTRIRGADQRLPALLLGPLLRRGRRMAGPYGGGGHPSARAGLGRCGAWPARRPAALPPRRAAGGGGRSSCIYGWAAPRIAAYRDPGGLGCAQQTARAGKCHDLFHGARIVRPMSLLRSHSIVS